MKKRHTGIDLHTNSFTYCILQEDREEVMQTWSLRKRDVSRFIATLAVGRRGHLGGHRKQRLVSQKSGAE